MVLHSSGVITPCVLIWGTNMLYPGVECSKRLGKIVIKLTYNQWKLTKVSGISTLKNTLYVEIFGALELVACFMLLKK